jgi:hypothetical protein
MMKTDHLARVRRMCLALPGATERPSHGEPTFFLRGKVFVMFANKHHGDGRIAVWLPVPAGMQQGVIDPFVRSLAEALTVAPKFTPRLV